MTNNTLNTEQQKAIDQADGPIIILAGAGSGKTRVLIHKVLELIEKGVDPQNILMVTFTNKAAGEMLERIQHILGKKYSMPLVGTFHSLCAKILRKEGKYIGIPVSFQIFDSQDQVSIIKDALQKLDMPIKTFKPKAILNMISSAKNQMVTPEIYTGMARGYFQQEVARVYPEYQSLLKEHDAVDFDDLLLETIRLFKNNPEVLEKYQEKFEYTLVDEYQDTNQAQYTLTKLLCGKTRNICVVGDFSQSIYSFRGADFRNLERFKMDFPDAKTFPLSQNYRSTQKILEAAYSVISNNNTHPVLSLWTKNKEGDDLTIFQADNEHQEAEMIIQRLYQHTAADDSFSFSDAAILYRTNAQSRSIEETFLHNGIPYTLVGGTRFYERREIKDVLAYLSILANPKNSVALKRIMKLGKKRFQLFNEYAEKIIEEKLKEEKDTIDILDEVLKKTDYLALYDEQDPEDKARIENIKELRSVAIEFPTLPQFLENVALVEQENMPDKLDSKGKPDAVTLMTIHAAKGLEFKIVFIVGMEEGLFPHSQALLDAGEVEEERRLCYVAITRAREKLYMSFAKRRLFYGQVSSNTISRFIYELPEEVLTINYIDRVTDEPSFL